MSNLTTLPKGDSAWLLRKSIQRIMQQVSVLETNIGSSTTGNSSDTQIIFNDAGTLRGDSGLTYNKTTDLLSVGAATISGDLTVDTNVLKVDTTNNRVGVNTASPATDLEVRSIVFTEGTIRLYSAIDGSNASPKGSYFSFRSGTTGSGTETARLSSLNRFSNVLGGDFSISTADTSNVLQNRLTIDSGGVFTFAVGGSTAMTLNATGLGVGGSPAYKLDVLGSATISGRFKTSGALNALYLEDGGTTPGSLYIGTSGDTFRIITGSNVRMNVDVNGNVGIGVTPSAWSSMLALQVRGASLACDATIHRGRLLTNAFFDGAGYKYIQTNFASMYLQNSADGAQSWHTAPSGTAGNATTFTQAMTLDASGRLLVGPTSANTSGGVLQLSSGITFPATQVASSDANTLDDYEEGTWTGTLRGSVSDPTTPVTANGRYTKVGRLVTVHIDFGAFNSTGASGNATITGLPFANGLLSCGSVESGAALTFSGTLAADVSTGGTTIQLQSITSNNFALFATHNAGNPRYLTVTLTYTV